jgi:hypothetical protein
MDLAALQLGMREPLGYREHRWCESGRVFQPHGGWLHF